LADIDETAGNNKPGSFKLCGVPICNGLSQRSLLTGSKAYNVFELVDRHLIELALEFVSHYLMLATECTTPASYTFG
jgi:hypothetical protein